MHTKLNDPHATVKWYRKKTTKLIHMTCKFPEPLREHHSQCGQSLSGMVELTKREVRDRPDHEFCRKCTQLIGLY